MQLHATDVEREAIDVARKNLGAANVVRAMAEPTVDLDGDDTWRIIIVLQPEAVDAITGDAVLDNLVEIHNRLWEKGEERVPMVQFATEQELRESDSPEC
jgi:hypothetical protein